MLTTETLMQQSQPAQLHPWIKFQKGNDGRVDKLQPSLTYRFLRELCKIPFSLSHWDHELRKAVSCNKTMSRGNDGRIWLNGQCDYCDMRKAVKANYTPTKEKPYPPNTWDLRVVIVAPISVLNEDGSQTFKLAALNAKDFVYPVGKGVYKSLAEFTELRGAAKKPSKLTDYWWIMSPEFKLMADERVDAKDLVVVPDGFIDDDGNEYDLQSASPFSYKEAMRMRQELAETDSEAVPYTTSNYSPLPQEVAKQEVAVKEQTQASSGLFDDDDIPPF